MSILGSFIMPHPPIIVKEVGRGQENEIQQTIEAFEICAKRIQELKPETIVLTTPHAVQYLDYFHISPGESAKGDFRNFSAGEVQIEVDYDEELVKEITEQASADKLAAGVIGEREPELDHGTLVPLYFINQMYQNYKLVRIGLSGLSQKDHYQFGISIKKAIDRLSRDVVIIASGDLSHKLLESGPYGYAPEGVAFDHDIIQVMKHGNFMKLFQFQSDDLEKAAQCGLNSFLIMAGTFDKQDVKSEFLSYEGPFGVGYGVASFLPEKRNNQRCFLEILKKDGEVEMEERRKSESEYVNLARTVLEHYISHGEMLDIKKIAPKEFLNERAGVFVSIKKSGDLRGCIGTILPTTSNVGEEIKQNAISAGTKDPRFPPIIKEELDELVYNVDVLTKPEPILTERDLDPKKYGVIVMSDRNQGVLLPDLEGVDTVEQQLSIAKQKAGITEDEKVHLARFEVVRYR